MKKLLLSLVALVAAVCVNAQTVVTFDATADKSASGANAGECSIEKDGVTIAVSNGILGNGTEYRIYKSQTLTVSSTVGNIVSIDFTCTVNGEKTYGPGCFASQEGYSYEGNVGTWEGSAASVVFSASSNQVRATKIVVTIAGEGGETNVAAPKASVASGTYYEPQTVTLTCKDAEATIKYQIDGEGYEAYTAPLTIENSCQLQAYAQKGERKSDVVTYDYVIKELTGSTLAEVNALANGTAAVISEALTVVFVKGSYCYVYAGGTYGLIYGTTSYKAGDVIPAGLNVSVKIYNGLIELVPGSQLPEATEGGIVPQPIEVADPTTIVAADMNKYIVMKNVTVNSMSGKNATAVVNGKTIALYNNLGVTYPQEETTYEAVEGFVSIYNSNIQIYPSRLKLADNAVAAPIASVASGTFTEAQTVTLTCETEGATIMYQIDGEGYETYTEPIVIGNTCKLEAYAEKNGVKSDVVTYEYAIVTLKHITIGEFLEKADVNTPYELTGVVASIANATYGNLYLAEGKDTVYVYGVLDLNGAAKNFASLNVEAKDTITIVGTYSIYNDAPQIKNAQFVSVAKYKGEEGGGEEGDDPVVEPEGTNILANGDFETWTDDQPDFWKSECTASNAVLTQSTDARSGNYAVNVGGASSSNKRMAYAEREFSAGAYSFAFYAKATAAGNMQTRAGYAPIKVDGTMGSYVYAKDYVTLKEGTWTLVRFDFEITEPTKLCLVVMNPKSNEGNAILVDDAMLVTENGEVTAVETIKAAEQQTIDAIYSISGQRLQKPVKGLNIINGKKVLY